MLSRSRLLSIMLAAWAAFTFSFTACSGEDGADGVAGKDAEEVNVDSLAKAIRTKVTKDTKKVDVDSLADAIRSEVTKTLWDSLYAEPYVDTIYNILFDNTYSEDWMDSIREALIDSLKDADYDSAANGGASASSAPRRSSSPRLPRYGSTAPRWKT